jgi:chromate transport protein ChrA
VLYFLRLGLLGFGGPVALVGQMERELVTERRWLSKEQMREAIAVCQSLPGPLAIQVGVFISYLRGGFWGARLGMEDWLQWGIAAACLLVTVVLQSEVALLFIGAGTLGVLYYGTLSRRPPRTTTLLVVLPGVPAVSSPLPGKILLFFLKAGALTFGSGLVIVPFLQQGVGFVKGAYAAAIGTILGASALLGRIAIGDWLTFLIGLASLVVLFRWKVSNPLLIATAAAVGLIAFPLLHPAWVMVR